MATGAIFLLATRHELTAVNIFMTLRALIRRVREIGARLCIGGKPGGSLVATEAGCTLMRALQRETCRRMVKRTNFFPLAGVMTRFACVLGLRGSEPMRIGVTPGAGLIREMILALGCSGGVCQWLVAIHAYHCRMGVR
jgi:hypothetical protein